MKSLSFILPLFTFHKIFSQDIYLFHTADSTIMQSPLARTVLPNDGNGISMAIPLPGGKSFNINLRPSYTNEPSTFTTKNKLLVLSDIEGEFSAFRQLM